MYTIRAGTILSESYNFRKLATFFFGGGIIVDATIHLPLLLVCRPLLRAFCVLGLLLHLLNRLMMNRPLIASPWRQSIRYLKQHVQLVLLI